MQCAHAHACVFPCARVRRQPVSALIPTGFARGQICPPAAHTHRLSQNPPGRLWVPSPCTLPAPAQPSTIAWLSTTGTQASPAQSRAFMDGERILWSLQHLPKGGGEPHASAESGQPPAGMDPASGLDPCSQHRDAPCQLEPAITSASFPPRQLATVCFHHALACTAAMGRGGPAAIASTCTGFPTWQSPVSSASPSRLVPGESLMSHNRDEPVFPGESPFPDLDKGSPRAGVEPLKAVSCKQARAGQPGGLDVGERMDRQISSGTASTLPPPKKLSSALLCPARSSAPSLERCISAKEGWHEGQPSSQMVPHMGTKPFAALSADFAFFSPATCGTKERVCGLWEKVRCRGA